MAEGQVTLCFDVSTRSTGVAFGHTRDRGPTTMVWKHGDAAASILERHADLARRTIELTKLVKPRAVFIEAPLDPTAPGVKTTADTANALIGGARLVATLAYMRGVWDVRFPGVQEVRKYFTGHARFKEQYDPQTKRILKSRQVAKIATMNACRLRGWQVENDDAADAAALWAFSCSLVDPQSEINTRIMAGVRA